MKINRIESNGELKEGIRLPMLSVEEEQIALDLKATFGNLELAHHFAMYGETAFRLDGVQSQFNQAQQRLVDHLKRDASQKAQKGSGLNGKAKKS